MIALDGVEGIHHVTAVCSDAQTNVDFYAGLLGLRLVKRSINQANPRIYHLFYGAWDARPGTLITFFPYRRLPRGRAGAGMVHRVVFAVASAAALEFWSSRLGVPVSGSSLVCTDPDGLELELVVSAGLGDRHVTVPEPGTLSADSEIPAVPPGAPAADSEIPAVPSDAPAADSEIPAAFALGPLACVRAFERAVDPGWPAGFVADPAPELPGRKGAGTVHHVAFTVPDAAFDAWQARLVAAGVELVDVADRFYFRSLYFHEPGGVLFELATAGPGLTVDEPIETLGSRLSVPPEFAGQVGELEPLVIPRS